MNQYIIDETMLQAWREGCVNLSNPHTNDDICKKCEYHGTGMRKECCDFDDNTMEKIFRSHPYQSERDKVLDGLDIELDEIKSRIKSSAMGWPLSERSRGEIIGLLHVREKIKYLRQAGEP